MTQQTTMALATAFVLGGVAVHFVSPVYAQGPRVK